MQLPRRPLVVRVAMLGVVAVASGSPVFVRRTLGPFKVQPGTKLQYSIEGQYRYRAAAGQIGDLAHRAYHATALPSLLLGGGGMRCVSTYPGPPNVIRCVELG